LPEDLGALLRSLTRIRDDLDGMFGNLYYFRFLFGRFAQFLVLQKSQDPVLRILPKRHGSLYMSDYELIWHRSSETQSFSQFTSIRTR
jgi:hypothetical protein